MAFAAHGVYGTAAITALTIQSTLGVEASHPVDPNQLDATLACLDADLRPSGVKIGMVSSSNNMLIIKGYIHALKPQHSTSPNIPIVLDPILVSSSGQPLLDAQGIEALKAGLLPLVDWVTPNADELAALAGRPIRSAEDLAARARELQIQSGLRPSGAKLGVFAKGGHLDPPDDLLLSPDGHAHWLPGERIHTNATHGTGCALSSAFLCNLVLDDGPLDAARKAKNYVREAMLQAPGIGQGKGPMSLLWPLLPTPRR